VYNEDFIYTSECYTNGNALYKSCVCMYLPHVLRHTKITMICQQEMHNFASDTGFIVCAWHFVYENVFKYARICSAGFTKSRFQNSNVLLSDP
jgi:hypothetical protein